MITEFPGMCWVLVALCASVLLMLPNLPNSFPTIKFSIPHHHPKPSIDFLQPNLINESVNQHAIQQDKHLQTASFIVNIKSLNRLLTNAIHNAFLLFLRAAVNAAAAFHKKIESILLRSIDSPSILDSGIANNDSTYQYYLSLLGKEKADKLFASFNSEVLQSSIVKELCRQSKIELTPHLVYRFFEATDWIGHYHGKRWFLLL